MKKRSAVDPTTLTPEEQVSRYDEIIAILAEEPADDAGKIGQYVQVAGIVNRPAAAAETEETTTEETTAEETTPEDEETDEDEDEDEAAKNARAVSIANSKEGKANPAAALKAIQAGLSLKQFKAMAPSLSKSRASAFHERMNADPSTARLGGDGGAPARGANVTELNPQKIYQNRAAAAGGKKN